MYVPVNSPWWGNATITLWFLPWLMLHKCHENQASRFLVILLTRDRTNERKVLYSGNRYWCSWYLMIKTYCLNVQWNETWAGSRRSTAQDAVTPKVHLISTILKMEQVEQYWVVAFTNDLETKVTRTCFLRECILDFTALLKLQVWQDVERQMNWSLSPDMLSSSGLYNPISVYLFLQLCKLHIDLVINICNEHNSTHLLGSHWLQSLYE